MPSKCSGVRLLLLELCRDSSPHKTWSNIRSYINAAKPCAITERNLLDRFAYFVHILNTQHIYPYKSWIYKVNETFCSSTSLIEMAGPLSVHLRSNLVLRLV